MRLKKQRLLVKKSDFTQTRLLFVVEALKDLLANDGFVNLLRAEGLATMPSGAQSPRLEAIMTDETEGPGGWSYSPRLRAGFSDDSGRGDRSLKTLPDGAKG